MASQSPPGVPGCRRSAGGSSQLRAPGCRRSEAWGGGGAPGHPPPGEVGLHHPEDHPLGDERRRARRGGW
eukprot:1724659-Alexandrium_andersonii.AAC.1